MFCMPQLLSLSLRKRVNFVLLCTEGTDIDVYVDKERERTGRFAGAYARRHRTKNHQLESVDGTQL